MPVSTIGRGSTQDNTNGVPVAQAVNEVGGTPIIQTMVPEGNKTTYSSTSRTSITTSDAPSGGDLSISTFGTSLVDLYNALGISIRATCTVASTTMAGRVIFYDENSNVTGYSELLTFSSDATLRLSLSNDYVCQRFIIDAGSARKGKFLVTSVTSGTWSVYMRPV